jgi:hypothetical protein
MRRTLLILLFAIAAVAAPLTFAAPGSVRCGKLLDVRLGGC